MITETIDGNTTTYIFNGADVTGILFIGGAGNDEFINQSGVSNSFSYGGSGNDHIESQGTLKGGADNDWLVGYGIDDYIYGEDGDDILDGAFHLYGGADNDTLYGSDLVQPSDGDVQFEDGISDLMEGGAGDDILWGYGGRDLMYGGDGVDTLHGGDGDDLLDGGAGEFDELWGGPGADEFRADWLSRLPINRDEPQDYSITELDTISPEWDGSGLFPAEARVFDLISQSQTGLGTPVIPVFDQIDVMRLGTLDTLFATLPMWLEERRTGVVQPFDFPDL